MRARVGYAGDVSRDQGSGETLWYGGDWLAGKDNVMNGVKSKWCCWILIAVYAKMAESNAEEMVTGRGYFLNDRHVSSVTPLCAMCLLSDTHQVQFRPTGSIAKRCLRSRKVRCHFDHRKCRRNREYGDFDWDA
nr:hypothetical protein Iba_chr10aCG11220 [Ipomoea batatas]